MGVNCLIFAGDSIMPCVSKYAGPYRIATELRKNDFTVQVVDLGGEQSYNRVIKKVVKKFVDKSTLWIGFSANFLQHILGYRYTNNPVGKQKYFEKEPNCDQQIKELMDHARSINPDIQFVVGGIKTFDFSHLGFYTFIGYTDQEIVDFTVNCKEKNYPTSKIIQNSEFKNFTKSQIDYTKHDVFNNERSLPIEIGRGCIFKCKFCSYPLIGKTKHDYIRDYSLIKEEMIKNYERFGITHYNFAEDTFNDSTIKLEALLENVFSKLPFKITFAAYLRLDLLMRFPEMQDILVESGLKSGVFGIETLNPTNAKIIGKGIDPARQIEAVARLKQDKFKNINCASGFIFGLPDDSIESLEKHTEWFLSDNNPLDDWNIETLFIAPKGYDVNLPYKSEFDVNYEKYGYSFSHNDDGWVVWTNDQNKLNQEDIVLRVEHARSLSLKSHKKKYGNFTYSAALDLGYDQDLLTIKSRIELDKMYNKPKVLQDKKISYYKNLLNLS